METLATVAYKEFKKTGAFLTSWLCKTIARRQFLRFLADSPAPTR